MYCVSDRNKNNNTKTLINKNIDFKNTYSSLCKINIFKVKNI